MRLGRFKYKKFLLQKMDSTIKNLGICALLSASIISSPASASTTRSIDKLVDVEKGKFERLNQENLSFNFQMAYELILKGDYRGARERLEYTEQSEPTNTYLHAMKGYLAYVEGDEDTAFQYFEESLRFNKGVSKLLIKLGLADLIINRKHELAADYFNDLSIIIGSSHELTCYQGLNFLMMKKFETSIACFQKSIELKPTDLAYFGLSKAYECLGDKKSAKMYSEKIRIKK